MRGPGRVVPGPDAKRHTRHGARIGAQAPCAVARQHWGMAHLDLESKQRQTCSNRFRPHLSTTNSLRRANEQRVENELREQSVNYSKKGMRRNAETRVGDEFNECREQRLRKYRNKFPSAKVSLPSCVVL